MVQLRRTAATAEVYDLECELISSGPGQGALPRPRDRRPGRRHLAARRRDGQPGRRDGVAGPGRPGPGRPRVRAHPGGRHRTGRRSGDRGRHRPGHHRGRGGRELRRAVGQGGRRPGRGQRAPALGRALLRGVRADRGCPYRPAHPAGPGRLHVLQGGGRRAGDRRDSSPRRSRGWRPTGCRTRSSSSSSTRTGTTSPSSWRAPLQRIPALHHTGIRKFYNGPESFTPDNQFIVGEAPELANFFVGAGFNSVGIASAGGAGRALAEWIVDGEPTVDLVAQDIRRFAPFNGNNQWLHDRVGEILGLHYEIPWPNRELVSARPFRRSPVYHLLEASGAQFGSKMGWERANVFAPPGPGAGPRLHVGPAGLAGLVGRRAASGPARRSTLFDETSFGKLLLSGRDAEPVLQRLCTADVAVPVGRAVYTGMLNRRGGYEADVTVTRLSHDRYLLVTGSASVLRDLAWIERHTSPDEHVAVVDVSSAYAVYGVMGPRSREAAAAADPGGPVRRGVPLRHQPGDRPRPLDGAGHPHHLCRRAGMGALRAHRVRRGRLRGPARGRRRRPADRGGLLRRSTRCAWTRATGPSAPT